MLELLIFVASIIAFFVFRKAIKSWARVSQEYSLAYQKEAFITLRKKGDEISKRRKEVEGMPLPSEIPD